VRIPRAAAVAHRRAVPGLADPHHLAAVELL
jgi:hypothetical protein